ncbi:anti-sigma factor family protein [Streptomyces sp. NPDC050658]|uniref:anti-sigma factor family protein n=1 Tax=unclassified Streptomyces TaxID=2593676 RepID=UPI00342DD5C2
MSGSRSNPAERRIAEAEQHLGDRLAALVDGELGHDARERVLAHLATCPKCKTEADAQRRLKSVFAEVAPPPPSESFLARLQGLPGGGSEPPGGPRSPGGGFATADSESGLPPTGVFGVKGESFGYVPSGAHAAVLPGEGRGFRLHDLGRHDVGRPDAERSLWRGRRFAFAAAGAVSLAAIALGGVTTGIPADPGDSRAGGSGSSSNSNASPVRSQGSGASTAPDSSRRRGSGPLSAQGQRPGVLAAPVAPTEVTGPLLPGGAGQGPRVQEPVQSAAAPLVAGAAVMSPLIRPVTPVPLGVTPVPGADPRRTAASSPIEGTLQGTSQIR